MARAYPEMRALPYRAPGTARPASAPRFAHKETTTTADDGGSLVLMEKRAPKIWVLTGSLDNFRATAEHEFRLIGMKERRRGLAEQIDEGDVIVFYVTGVQAFGGTVRVTSDMYEDRTKIWPGK